MRKVYLSNEKILINKIKCNKCFDIIESKYIHDFNICSCGSCGIDGGKEVLLRTGNSSNIIDLSETSLEKYKIISNKIKCKLCNNIIESKYVNEFVMCNCNFCGVAGNYEYLRRIGDITLYEELSIIN